MSYNKVASFRKSEHKYFVASRWVTGETEYSGICEMVNINGEWLPTNNNNKMFWRADLDDQILLLVESLMNEKKTKPISKVEKKQTGKT